MCHSVLPTPASAAARMMKMTFTPNTKLARKAPAISARERALRSLATPAPRPQATSSITAATPACMPFSASATQRLAAKAA